MTRRWPALRPAAVSLLLVAVAAVGAALLLAPAGAQELMRSHEGALGDGLREPVPSEETPDGRDATPVEEADGVESGGPGQESSSREDEATVELDRADEDVEGEGRGAGELLSGLPARTLLIVVALLVAVGAFAALVLTRRRRRQRAPTDAG